MKKYIKSKILIVSLIVLFTIVCIIQIGVATGMANAAEIKEPVKVQESVEGKVSEELNGKISEATEKEKIPVSVWINDIDYAKVDEAAIDKVDITNVSTASAPIVTEYIRVTRNLARIEHIEDNESFIDELGEDVETIHVDKYAPNVLLYVSKDKLVELAENKDVVSIDLYQNEKKVQETVNSIPDITADYVKGLGLNGSGVNVGVLEYTTDDHANTVKNIITDISPNANVVMKYGHNKTEDYARINEFISEGINVINYSAGYPADAGTYSDFDSYVDYIVSNYDITFVKSAGNQSGGNYYITNPGMAYNGITVGSINENDTTSWTDDVFSTFSRYMEYGGASKPDITAPGEGIYGNKSGTSYSAPHVVGVIALLMQQNPALKTYPEVVKSLVAAGTFHKTASDYGDNLWSPYYSNKEGAGVIDAKGAYRILTSNNIKQKTLANNQFPYQDTFYVYQLNKKVRIALSWIKKDNLSDLDITIKGPTNNTVGYSLSSSNNTELIEFNPRNLRGTYKIIIEGYNLVNNNEEIGITWQQTE